MLVRFSSADRDAIVLSSLIICSQPAISSLQAAQNTVAMANLKRNNPSSGSAIPFRPSLQTQLSNGFMAAVNNVSTMGGPPARKKTRMG